MTANDSKSYFPYLNQLVDEHNNTYHHSINKKPIKADCSALTEKIETNSKAPKFKVIDKFRVTKYTNIFSKGYNENWPGEIFIIDSVLKSNTWTYKVKDLNKEKMIERFYEKELLRSILQMSYYSESDSHIGDKVKLVLDLSNYTTKKELEHATGIDTSDLAAKNYFIVFKAEVDKLDIMFQLV